jgi:hypothetical protein
MFQVTVGEFVGAFHHTHKHTPEAVNAMTFNGIGTPMLMDGPKITNAQWMVSTFPVWYMDG